MFGAVSISERYARASCDLIVRFFKSRSAGDELGPLVRPRRPFRPGRSRSWDCRLIDHSMLELDQLSDRITDMEDDGKGIPILLKHYSRLGGRLLGFNVDPKFSHVLDGLVVMDLRQTEPASIKRYMGKPTWRPSDGITDCRLCRIATERKSKPSRTSIPARRTEAGDCPNHL